MTTATPIRPTKERVARLEANLEHVATKEDLSSLRADLYKAIFAAVIAQTALIVGLLKLIS